MAKKGFKKKKSTGSTSQQSTTSSGSTRVTTRTKLSDYKFNVGEARNASEFNQICTYLYMFMSKRARPDVQPVVSFLSTRTTCSTDHDWAKLSRMMNFLYRTKDDVLKFSVDGSYKIIWYVEGKIRTIVPRIRISLWSFDATILDPNHFYWKEWLLVSSLVVKQKKLQG